MKDTGQITQSHSLDLFSGLQFSLGVLCVPLMGRLELLRLQVHVKDKQNKATAEEKQTKKQTPNNKCIDMIPIQMCLY